MKRPDLARRLSLGLSLLVLIAGAVGIKTEPGVVVRLRNGLFDFYQQMAPRPYQPGPVRVVDIDEESLARVGQWPWPRTTIAALIQRLQAMGAASIALDIVFAEPDRSTPRLALQPWGDRPAIAQLIAELPDHDQVLAATIATGDVVTGFALSDEAHDASPPVIPARFVFRGPPLAPSVLPGAERAVATLPILAAGAAGNGTISFSADVDGVIRRTPLFLRLGDKIVPSLAAEALRLALGRRPFLIATETVGVNEGAAATAMTGVQIGPLSLPIDRTGQAWLHYGRPVPDRTVPAWQLLAGTVPDAAIAGAIIFVGTSAEGLKDLRFGALGTALPGVEIHAQMTEQALQGTLLNRPGWLADGELAGLLLIGGLLIWGIGRLRIIWASVLVAAVLAAMIAGSWLAFTQALMLVDAGLPALILLAVFLARTLPHHIVEEQQHRWIQQAFSRFVSPNRVRHLIDHPEQLQLGGEYRSCTFVMTDLESFTGLMEKFPPQAMVALLNEYLDGMVRIAFAHDGTLDRIVGDAVAVMFSAPVDQPDHAARGVACALAMHNFAEAFARRQHGLGIPFGRTRIGVHSGRVLVGNFGGEVMFDYRALGDPVNTASRLEGVNKQIGTNICVSGATVEGCPTFHGRPIGTLVLKGKTEGIPAFEPMTETAAASPATETYRRAFGLLAEDPTAAAVLFDGLAAHDPLADFHRRRLARGETGERIVFTEK